MTDWLAIAAIAISALTALVGALGYVQSKRTQDRKGADVTRGQLFLLEDYVVVLRKQLIDANVQPEPFPDGIFPKE